MYYVIVCWTLCEIENFFFRRMKTNIIKFDAIMIVQSKIEVTVLRGDDKYQRFYPHKEGML